MLAARLYKAGDLRIEEMPIPTPGPQEALIKVNAVGICASDVHWYNEGRIGETVLTDPLILGHEFAGTVVEGAGKFRPGDRVAVEPAIHCGTCDMCLRGRYNICRHVRFCGTPPTDGALREYLSWPIGLLAPIPDSISMQEAAMLEPMAIGVHAANLAGNLEGKTAAILGTGAVGLSILQAILNAVCDRVFVSDLYAKRLKLAKQLGAELAFNAVEDDVLEQLMDATDGRGVDIVFEAAGENDAVRMATKIAKPGGLIVIGGIPDDDIMMVEASVVRRKELTLQLLRRSNNTLHTAIHMLTEGKIDLECYVTHQFRLEEVKKGFSVTRDDKANSVRVIINI